MESKVIRQEARQLLQNRWNKLILLWVIFFVISLVSSLFDYVLPHTSFVVSLLIGGPFALAISAIFLGLHRGEDFEHADLFQGFAQFTRCLVAYLLMSLYVLLWLLLLIVPGIIASIKYSQTFFIMAEDPNISGPDAITLSKNMMQGHKAEYFWLQLSFIGWALLAVLSLGIGFLWLTSYIAMAQAVFYKKVKAQYEQSSRIAQPVMQ